MDFDPDLGFLDVELTAARMRAPLHGLTSSSFGECLYVCGCAGWNPYRDCRMRTVQ